MDKKLRRGLMLLITYAVLLILVILRFDDLRGLLGRVLEVFQPLFLGFAIAFILNRPCRFFLRTYQKGLPGLWVLTAVTVGAGSSAFRECCWGCLWPRRSTPSSRPTCAGGPTAPAIESQRRFPGPGKRRFLPLRSDK